MLINRFGDKRQARTSSSLWILVLASVVVLVAFLGISRTILIEVYWGLYAGEMWTEEVSSTAMAPALQKGQRAIVRRLTDDERNDVSLLRGKAVLFLIGDWDGLGFSRIVGVPGDMAAYSVAGVHIIPAGSAGVVDACYDHEARIIDTWITPLPVGEVYVAADNCGDTLDSRESTIAQIYVSKIMGVILYGMDDWFTLTAITQEEHQP